MEHLAILEKICDNFNDTLDIGKPIYIFAAAIYDTWSNGNELEKNLVKRLQDKWRLCLVKKLDNDVKGPDEVDNDNYDEEFSEYDRKQKQWIEDNYRKYKDNKGIRWALDEIWRNRFRVRIYWPD
jgi:hypothetical protein